VTQGIFPEGGLTRDGRLRPAKIGVLDYALGVARDQRAAELFGVRPHRLDAAIEHALREWEASEPLAAR
jgi:hypothetical protein